MFYSTRMVFRSGRRITLRGSLFPLLLASIVGTVWILREPLRGIMGSPESLEAFLSGTGWWAPIALVGFQFLQVIIFVIPGEVVQIAAGYLYGVAGGTLLSVSGIMLGSVVNYQVGRFSGEPFLRGLAPRSYSRFQYLTATRKTEVGFFLLFLIPGFPKDFLCYIAGMSSLSFFRFFVLSLAGRLPGVIGSAFIGSAAAKERYGVSLIVFALSVGVAGAFFLFRDRLERVVRRKSGVSNGGG